MSGYMPELGQVAFGQLWQPFECPPEVLNVLNALRDELQATKGIDPFGNSGQEFKNRTFQVEAYSWGDDSQPWNFKWGDVEISWYKWLGRGTTINSDLDAPTIARMKQECLDSLEAQP